MLGSGGVIVIDDQTCMVKFALRTNQFYRHESCGWCIPCREGTDWLQKTLRRFHAGGGVGQGHRQPAVSWPRTCWAAPSARWAMPRPCRSSALIKKFRAEFEAHLDGRPCPFERHRERRRASGRNRATLRRKSWTRRGPSCARREGNVMDDGTRRASIPDAIAPCEKRAARQPRWRAVRCGAPQVAEHVATASVQMQVAFPG